jgi:hypothetical protein
MTDGDSPDERRVESDREAPSRSDDGSRDSSTGAVPSFGTLFDRAPAGVAVDAVVAALRADRTGEE